MFDPITRPDPDRDDEVRANGTYVEIRPQARIARLATRALACPACGVPVALSAPVGWSEEIACSFCESIAPTRDYIQERGWPEVNVIARFG